MNKMHNYIELSDSELISLILQRDYSAIEMFFYVKCASLFSFLSKNFFQSTVSEDELRNELFLYFQNDDWHVLKTYKGDASLLTWTHVVACRYFSKRKKYFVMENNIPIEDLSDSNLDNNDDIIHSISKFELYDAIKKMSNERYKYLIICELRGMRPEEIARDLEINIDNFYTLKMRAKKQLLLTINL